MPKFADLSSLVFLALALTVSSSAQVSGKTTPPDSAAADHAASLAETGHCSEALPLLTKSIAHTTDRTLQKRAGLDGVRCATLLQTWDALLDFVRILNRQFPHDPEVLYVSIHAYSDLSSQAAEKLAQTAPDSIPALEMDAEANEMQGKWDQAQKDYEKILAKDPRHPGIHFRMARLLLSEPNPPADFQDQAKKELQKELEIDPANAGAEYILGEIALQAQNYDEAIQHLKKATQLNPTFADAYLRLGASLLSQKKYADAIPPLEMAVKLQPANPMAHYSLGTAYSRTGRKAEAEHEFSLQAAEEHAAGGDQGPK